MNKKKDILIKLAILCAGYGIFADSVVVPLLTLIFGEFYDSGTFLMNFVISGPALISIPVALIAGKMAHFISKKDLLIVGFILYLIGGLGGIIAINMEFLAVTRAISGAAAGVIGTIALAFIPELYPKMEERSKVIGWYNAASAVFGTIMVFLAGLIAVNGWRNAFFINAFALISLLLIIYFLPRTAPEKEVKKEEIAEGKKENYPIIKVIVLMSAFFIFGTLYCIIYYCIDIYVAEKAMGTSVLTGAFSALGTVGSFISSLIFGNYYNKVKRMMPATFFLLGGICFTALMLLNNSILVSIACLIAGASYGLCLSYYAMALTEIVPESEMGLSMSFYMIIANVSAFISPYVPMIVQRIFGITTYVGTFLYIGIFLLIGALISWVLALRYRKNQLSV